MADSTLRQLVRWLVAETEVAVVADITRTHIEDYKVWLAAQPGIKGETMAKNTQRHRLRMIRIFFERIIEWDWDDAPRRNPIFHGDIAPRTDPLPKFLNDQDAAKLMAAARAHRLPRYRLVDRNVGLHRHAGERAVRPGRRRRHHDRRRLLAPNPRRQAPQRPLHPAAPRPVVAAWRNGRPHNSEYIRAQRHLMADDHEPLDRRTVHRIVATTAKRAGIGAVHPHQLRHTFATALEISEVAPDASFGMVRDRRPPGLTCPACGALLPADG